MQNKTSLLNLIARAEEGRLLPGEAQILRDAVEKLDELSMALEEMSHGNLGKAGYFGEYTPSTTQAFRLLEEGARKTESGEARDFPQYPDSEFPECP
ncbi:hypothetical protein [Streptomyces sp. S1]|uniref:hypothetical protein n=1 Tax=Streptomyces sp. S1 TaxID=718288 RepID=UPI003D758B82